MTPQQTKYIIQKLTEKGVHFEHGLADKEILQVETKFNLKFPIDLKLFLQTALPTSDNFVDWRLGLHSHEETIKIQERLMWPLEGLLYDLRSEEFWITSWGDKPNDYDDKVQIAKEKYLTFPKLIPIYSHRYIPSMPNEEGNPVFSVHQMDIIYYGFDLATYFSNEFNFKLTNDFELLEELRRQIEFWSQWVDEWT